MKNEKRLNTALYVGALLSALNLTGCASNEPSIAHTHLGHAVTGVHVTPNNEGYLQVAEKRGIAARDSALIATTTLDLAGIQANIRTTADAVSSDDGFGLKESIIQAANHITFASTSDDASENLKQSAPSFAANISQVVERCELIELLAADVVAASNVSEALLLSNEILNLTEANIDGADTNGDGIRGNAPNEYGMRQLRAAVDAIIADESPEYTVVDDWHLFNLVRLPNGLWVWDKLGRGGNIEGYK